VTGKEEIRLRLRRSAVWVSLVVVLTALVAEVALASGTATVEIT